MKKNAPSICQRCKTAFECKAADIANCQCATVTLSKKTVQFLKTKNYGCLCKNCLLEINQKSKKNLF